MDEIVGSGGLGADIATDGSACSDAAGDIDETKDWCIELDGERYAGLHLLVEFWDAQNLSDLSFIEAALTDAARAAKARVLETKFHKFTPSGGVTGVALLAESHISIHTWPEHNYAAIDVFMCGTCNPHDAVPVLEKAFAPQRSQVIEQRRGKISA
jgi:S-adenosylmethionine decarboxylase